MQKNISANIEQFWNFLLKTLKLVSAKFSFNKNKAELHSVQRVVVGTRLKIKFEKKIFRGIIGDLKNNSGSSNSKYGILSN